jgi:hypothetical protein
MGGAIDRLCVFNFEQRDAVAGLAELTSVDDGVVAGIPEGSRLPSFTVSLQRLPSFASHRNQPEYGSC